MIVSCYRFLTQLDLESKYSKNAEYIPCISYFIIGKNCTSFLLFKFCFLFVEIVFLHIVFFYLYVPR